MKKYFCDRCQAEIVYKNKKEIRTRAIYKGGGIVFKSKEEEFEFDHDLCEDCMESFYFWWNHPKQNEGGAI